LKTALVLLTGNEVRRRNHSKSQNQEKGIKKRNQVNR